MTEHVAGTEPYAWPFDGRLVGPHVALVLAGWDARWSGRAVVDDGVTERVAALAAAVAARGGMVLVLAHGGSEPLAPTDDDHHVVAVHGIDGFGGSQLDLMLRTTRRTHLLVAGNGIEGPVHSTLRSANDRGYECLLVTDACTALTTDLAEASAKTVTMSGGIFGAIGTTGAVLDALAGPPSVPDPVPAQEALT